MLGHHTGYLSLKRENLIMSYQILVLMSKSGFFWIGLVVLLILVYNFGLPDEINVFGAKWCIRNCDKQNTYKPETINIDQNQKNPSTNNYPNDYLSIVDLKSRQKIYSPEDLATVDFIVEDSKNIPYNLSVNWFYNGTRYHGWYNESNTTKPYYAWYTTNQKGDWDVQVILRWIYNDLSYFKDEVTKVKVV